MRMRTNVIAIGLAVVLAGCASTKTTPYMPVPTNPHAGKTGAELYALAETGGQELGYDEMRRAYLYIYELAGKTPTPTDPRKKRYRELLELLNGEEP